ncbi:hemerythrin domain-containing protein [Candidatus Magnetaquicoccus inordinatus]|uniref:hemerythrin domain-containing protein n=1 Tax=Candidatus Magnetaquicoccus inordinatus TaxID=2496818 RepID=UPI001D0F416D|nr:hemerythrin domain-containing protein [Candidatus Magnetaquicoccus inordinatus]
MSAVPLLDLTSVPTEQRLGQLLTALDGLSAGQSVTVRAPAQWDDLLPGMQAQRWGQYDWRPLFEGPDYSVVQLVRLQAGAANQTIPAFFTRDHHHCDALYAETENAANAGDTVRMAELCQQFLAAMTHHFRMEENGLFPAFENRTGMRQGPTMVMRSEHEQMRGLMRQMLQAAETADPDLMLKAGGTLLFVMQQHNVKEEQMLYPMSEMHLRPADTLLQEIQRL